MSALVFVRRRALGHAFSSNLFSRGLRTNSVRFNISQKYLDKVQKRAQEKGVTVEELKETIRKAEASKPIPIPEAIKLKDNAKKVGQKTEGGPTKAWSKSERKDNSPVRPLVEIMDIHKVIRTPHTKDQISALWTAFHASRSGGTGRGYLSASVPIQTYETLIKAAKKYPNFIMPLLRQPASSPSKGGEGAPQEQPAEPAYEFFFLQWGFHEASPIPVPNILDAPLPEGAIPPPPSVPLATVLFTPLLEYKTRATFATPHLVLTLYPELAKSHELVLLRGELTPSPAGGDRYLLSQQDAQLLALGLQRFYLPGAEDEDKGKKERAELLRVFNENPSQFSWEDLLRHADPTS